MIKIDISKNILKSPYLSSRRDIGRYFISIIHQLNLLYYQKNGVDPMFIYMSLEDGLSILEDISHTYMFRYKIIPSKLVKDGTIIATSKNLLNHD